MLTLERMVLCMQLEAEACKRLGCHIMRMPRGVNGELPHSVSWDCMAQADYALDAPDMIPGGGHWQGHRLYLDVYAPGEIMLHRE